MARVLFLSETYTVHDRRFLDKLAQTSHTVWFLPRVQHTPPLESRPLPKEIRGLPPVVDRAGPWGLADWYRGVKKVRGHLKSIQPEIIHAGPVATGTLLAALAGARPLMAMSWGSDVLTQANGWRACVTRYALRHSEMAVADCKAVQDRIMQLSHLKSQDIAVFPWGIDLKRFTPGKDETDLRKRFQLSDQSLVVYTRGFEPIHQPLLFLTAMEQVVRERPNAQAWMLGDGFLRKEVENFIQSHGLQASIHLAGRVSNEELPNYFRAADLYVSTTRSDGSSISLLEAMACGLPVIAVDAYGNPEWIRPGENGWLYPHDDPGVLSQLMIKTLDDRSLRQRMGENNIALARLRADWDINFKMLLDAYDRMLSRESDTHLLEERTAHARIQN